MSTKTRFDRGAAVPPEWTEEYLAIESAYQQAGGVPNQLWMPEIAVLVVSANRVLAANEIPGVSFEAEEMPDGVRAHIAVKPKAQIEQPVHLCFGMLPGSGRERR